MADSSLDEVINTIAPTRRPGIPNPPAIGVGVSSGDGDLAASLSQVGQQISQLQSAYQQQADLITANTQAIQSNTSSKGSSVASTVGSVASSLLGGLGLLSPLISGIESLFGGTSAPAPLPIYTPPPPVDISGVLQAVPGSTQASGAGGSTVQNFSSAQSSSASANTVQNSSSAQTTGGNANTVQNFNSTQATGGNANTVQNFNSTQSSGGNGNTSQSGSQTNSAPQITVNVNAMDSQSFMDHSTDIANAVREAMLNMHPINDVVANL